MRILVVNAGSSSLKLSILDERERLVTSHEVKASETSRQEDVLRELIESHGPIDAVGHRVVHGGSEFTEAVIVDDAVLRRLEALTDLAPLHQPESLEAFALASRLLPDVPAVACFDTAFHARMPLAASTYALPADWRQRWGLRRFGFHGLAHAYTSRRAAQLMGTRAETGRVVTCHLGSGASIAAVQRGVSVDTTMGFTPLEGLVMATRSGSVDPGLVLWLQEHAGIRASELAWSLEHHSGLLGLTGSDDMREVIEAEAVGEPDAVLGVAVYAHRLRSGIAAMAASMAGLDALVFSGGVGENSPAIRSRACDGLGFLGVSLDTQANEGARSDQEIGMANSSVRCFVIRAREDLEIAREVRELLSGS